MVDTDAVAAGAAKQAVDRLAPQLADQVPQGDVDARQGVDHERTAADIAASTRTVSGPMPDDPPVTTAALAATDL